MYILSSVSYYVHLYPILLQFLSSLLNDSNTKPIITYLFSHLLTWLKIYRDLGVILVQVSFETNRVPLEVWKIVESQYKFYVE